MKKQSILSLISGLVLTGAMIFGISTTAASAQVYTPYVAPVYAAAPVCLSLTVSLAPGSSDALTGGQVTQLQQFLNRTGYLSGVSGFYDNGTYGAVINFQRDHGIVQTGSVGPNTRAAINQVSCSGVGTVYGNTGYVGTPVIGSINTNGCSWNGSTYVCGYTSGYVSTPSYSYGNPIVCSNSYNSYGYNSNYYNNGYNNGYNQNSYCGVQLNSSSISYSGSTAYVTISGYGFSATGNTVSFGNTIVSSNAVSINGSTITFAVPTGYLYGTYSLSVRNAAGSISNTLSITMTGNTNQYNNGYGYSGNYNNGYYNNGYYSNTAPTLSNISGPSTVQYGTTNTWRVTVSSTNNQNTSITANWGDNYGNNANDTQQSYSTGSNTYSFSHTYAAPGTYTLRMTATSNNGLTSYATYNVTVTNYGTYYNYQY